MHEWLRDKLVGTWQEIWSGKHEDSVSDIGFYIYYVQPGIWFLKAFLKAENIMFFFFLNLTFS